MNFPPVNYIVMALKIIEHGTPEYQKMVKLREDILRKPLGLGFTTNELEQEKIVRLLQMAVLNDLQGKGIGRAIMHFAENIARDRGYSILSMHARKNAIGFYEKMGYKVTGDEFTEVTIPHYVMEKKL